MNLKIAFLSSNVPADVNIDVNIDVNGGSETIW